MKEALKLALDALMENEHYVAENERHAYVVLYNEVIEKCKAALAQPTSGDYALGYAEGFNDACKPAQPAPVQPVAMDEVRELSDGFIENPEAIKYLLDCLRKAQGEDGLSQAHYNFICAFQRKGYAVLQRLNEDYGPEWTFSKHATTPQQRPWVGLMVDERYECVHGDAEDSWDVAEAVEAKLKEKNA
jgi:hypothetical protein